MCLLSLTAFEQCEIRIGMFSCESENGIEKDGEALSIEVKVMSMFLHKDVKITINLNVRDIYDEDMIEMIFHYLKLADYPENFVFELVESEEVTDYQYLEHFAENIHNHGAKIAIDDFGSGFSNLFILLKSMRIF